MARTRIALAGAGTIGRAHADVLAASRTCALTAVADPTPAAASLAAARGVPHFATLDALLADARPDGIVIATPNALHLPQARRCIEAGLPVLVEKPITPSVAEGEALVALAESRGAKVLVGHHRAHSPIMAKAREIVAGGTLGRIVGVMASAVFCKPDRYFEEAPWRREPGGGPILINLIHEIHNLRLLCGEVVAVQAIASNAVRGFAVEDTVSVNLRFASGALASFMLSDTAASPRSWEQTSRENPAYATDPDEDCYVVCGTQGSLAVPTMRVKRYPDPADRSWLTPFACHTESIDRADPLALQMEHFGAVVRGEAMPLVTARDGLANVRVTEAIAAAARTGCTINL